VSFFANFVAFFAELTYIIERALGKSVHFNLPLGEPRPFYLKIEFFKNHFVLSFSKQITSSGAVIKNLYFFADNSICSIVKK
jgi:hypothetical protein